VILPSLLQDYDTVQFKREEQFSVASYECASLQAPNVSRETLRWQWVPGTGADAYVFSAFYDRRWNPAILLIIGVASEYQQRQDGPRQRYCRMWFRGEGKSRLVAAAFRRVKESNGDVTSGLARPLAIEIDISRISARGKPLIASKRYKIDGKCCWNTNRKPWSLYRLVTSLPVSDAP
jgi:hypothetical protein